jgi:hypothetical protein
MLFNVFMPETVVGSVTKTVATGHFFGFGGGGTTRCRTTSDKPVEALETRHMAAMWRNLWTRGLN